MDVYGNQGSKREFKKLLVCHRLSYNFNELKILIQRILAETKNWEAAFSPERLPEISMENFQGKP